MNNPLIIMYYMIVVYNDLCELNMFSREFYYYILEWMLSFLFIFFSMIFSSINTMYTFGLTPFIHKYADENIVSLTKSERDEYGECRRVQEKGRARGQKKTYK